MTTPQRIKVFISYSHEDAHWLERLQVHLKPLERKGLLERWDDTRIQPGMYRREAIEQALASAKVAVLLVSADFLASDFIAQHELPPLLKAAEQEGVLILPVIVGSCLFEQEPDLAQFQAVNAPDQPLDGLDKAEQEKRLLSVAKTIRNAVNPSDSIDQSARWALRDDFSKPLPQNLPYDSLGPLFKGREDLIGLIQAHLSAGPKQTTAIVAKQAIHGLGGVGKTRLAVEYAWRCLTDYTACLFVAADSPENLMRNLAELCSVRVLNLPEREAQEQELQVAATVNWLNQHPGWLLILDNVDTPEAAVAVKDLLPALQNGHVLITSRRTDWNDSIRTLALDTLSEDDAVAFLLEKTQGRRMATDTDKAAARLLAQTMDGLALALEQAGAFINRKRISFQTYQRRWTQGEAKLRHWYNEQLMQYPRSLAVTWETSFAQLTPAAQALLNLLSGFAPEPVPREGFEAAFHADTLAPLLTEAAQATPLPDLEDLLDELEGLSLIKWQSDNHTFSLHRLVQEITQARLGEHERTQALRVAVGLINQALPSDPPANDVRAWPVWDPWRPHIEQLMHAADDAGITDPTTRLMNDHAQYLKAKSLLREAEPLMRRALAIDEASFGPEHPEVAIRLNNLALLLKDTNRLGEAEPLMRRALSISEASLGPEHPRIATELNNLALLLQDTNRLGEAEPLMRRALRIDEASLGPEHPKVAIRLNKGFCVKRLQKYQ